MFNRTLIIGGLFAVIAGGQAAGQITGSPHDLSGVIFATDNGEICVYCHTPHGSRTDIEVPLWNKPASLGSRLIGYTAYDSTTADGDVLAVGSVSIACLTCHDGTQATDEVINAPGSGLGTGKISRYGVMSQNIAANLGLDLSDDHPIGVQYGGFDPGTGVIDPGFRTDELQKETIGGINRWWVDTSVGSEGKLDKTDMILYTRNNPNGGEQNVGEDQPFVECASCHDPHKGGGSPNFMRIANTNSDVCLACHMK